MRVSSANTAPLYYLFETRGVRQSGGQQSYAQGATHLQPGRRQARGVLRHCLEVQHGQAVRKRSCCRLRNPGRLKKANSLFVSDARSPTGLVHVMVRLMQNAYMHMHSSKTASGFKHSCSHLPSVLANCYVTGYLTIYLASSQLFWAKPPDHYN